MNEIRLSSIVVAADEQVSCDLAGEAVILHVKDGIYYGLDPVGARIWELLQQPQRVDEIRDRILEEYDVGRERCEEDLLRLLNEMCHRRLVEVLDESVA